MTSFGSRMLLTLSLAALSPFALVACGSSDGADGTATGGHAAHDGHADHAEHAEHAEHAGQGEGAAAPAMGPMGGEKVDPEGAARSFDHEPTAGEKAICPISGEAFTGAAGTATSEHEGGSCVGSTSGPRPLRST